MSRRRVAMIGLFLIMLPFQNCTVPRSEKTTGELDYASSGAGTGQPYDGKVYVVMDSCPDGTVVDSRLVLKDSGATLYRENCVTRAPKNISADQIVPLSSTSLRYGSRTFTMERPPISLPLIAGTQLSSWNYQLQGALTIRPASIYIIDMFNNSAASIQSLKNSGHTVICAMSAGSVESYRPDASSFRAEDIGLTLNGAPDERYLDIRSPDVRAKMLARLDLAKSKGCDGIDFDVVDAYANNTGFPISLQEQLAYNLFLAFAAHDRAMVLSLNGAPELAGDLAGMFDFAIAEQCFQYNECDRYQPFLEREKPVLAAEYGAYSAAQCRQAERMGVSLVFLNSELDGSRYESCQ